MAKNNRFLRVLALMMVGLVAGSCAMEGLEGLEGLEPKAKHPPAEIEQAREWFEEAIMSPEAGDAFEQGAGVGLDPGDFSIDWPAATLTKGPDNLTSVEVDIATIFSYSASWRYTDDSRVEVAQRLLLVRAEDDDDWSAYIMSVVPRTFGARDVASSARFRNGRHSPGFCGVVIYSLLGSNVTVRIDRYTDGEKTLGVSIFDGAEPELTAERMTSMLSDVTVFRHSRLRTRNSDEIDGGILESVAVTAYANGTMFTYLRYYLRDPYSLGGSSLPIAPNANKMFKGNLSADDWKKLEILINKIMSHCMGERLYNILLGRGLSIVYDPSATHDVYNSTSRKVTLQDLSSYGALTEELFHAYQCTTTTFWDYRRSNMEVEANIAKCIINMHHNPSYAQEYMKTTLGIHIMTLASWIDNKGAPLSGFTQNFREEYELAVREYSRMHGYSMSLSSIDLNIGLLQQLMTNC